MEIKSKGTPDNHRVLKVTLEEGESVIVEFHNADGSYLVEFKDTHTACYYKLPPEDQADVEDFEREHQIHRDRFCYLFRNEALNS